MDSMEDSGFDSDQKSTQNEMTESQTNTQTRQNGAYGRVSTNTYKKSTELQKKIEKHRENAAKRAVTQQPKKSYMLSRNRLSVPQKYDIKPTSPDQQPLVAIMSDDSEDDDFESPMLSKAAQKEITQQLMKDGYNLDLEPDDEDLDLIPPRPMHERCMCCQTYNGTCVIQ